MTALPMEARAAVAAILLISILRAFRGVPAGTPRLWLARQLIFMAVALEALTIVALVAGQPLLGAALAAAGVETACLSAWLGLGSGGPPDDDGDDGPEPVPPGPDIDWDEFIALGATGTARSRQPDLEVFGTLLVFRRLWRRRRKHWSPSRSSRTCSNRF